MTETILIESDFMTTGKTKVKMKGKDLALGGLFTALIAAGAFIQITIPVQPVPMHVTMQFFFVILSGLLLGAGRSFMSVCTYLLLGLCGFPIFASGGGPAYLLRPTFGFLIGFAAAGYLTGRVYAIRRKTSFFWLLFSAFLGLMADYACGMLYFYFCSNYVLGVEVGWRLVFINCFLLTVGQDFVLCVLAAMLAKRLIPALERAQGA